MIPRTINYIWLSGGKYSSIEKRCIKSWRKHLPNYKLVKWDIDKITNAASQANIENPLKVPFVAEAIKVKKWAFATDYLRQWVIYNFGGYYFDMDIAVNEKLGPALKQVENFNFVSCIEFHELEYKKLKAERQATGQQCEHVPGFCMQAALIGGTAHNKISKEILQYYDSQKFIREDGSNNIELVAPDIYALQAKKFGFRYILEDQEFGDASDTGDRREAVGARNVADLSNTNQASQLHEKYKIFGNWFCASSPYYANDKNAAFHLCEQSWKAPEKNQRAIKTLRLNKLYRKLKGQCKIF